MSTRAEIIAALAEYGAALQKEKLVSVAPFGELILRRRTIGEVWQDNDETFPSVAERNAANPDKVGQIALIQQTVFCEDGRAFTAAELEGFDPILFMALFAEVDAFYSAGSAKKN